MKFFRKKQYAVPKRHTTPYVEHKEVGRFMEWDESKAPTAIEDGEAPLEDFMKFAGAIPYRSRAESVALAAPGSNGSQNRNVGRVAVDPAILPDENTDSGEHLAIVIPFPNTDYKAAQ